MRRALSLLTAGAATFAVACGGHGRALRNHMVGVKTLTADAERNGALVCAPRQLALAHAELEFAELELKQGFPSKALAHLTRAELNVRAARHLSEHESCSSLKARRASHDVSSPSSDTTVPCFHSPVGCGTAPKPSPSDHLATALAKP